MAEVAEALVAIHSTDPATVYLSVRARTGRLDPAAIERELYEVRSVVRMLGMRRTLFVVPRALQPVVQSACTDAIAARERARLAGWIAASPGTRDAEAVRSSHLRRASTGLRATSSAVQADRQE